MDNQKSAATSLQNLYAPIEGELESVETRISDELSSDNPFVQNLIDHSSKFQGKRLRPALLLYSARVFGEIDDLHIGLSTVVELVHNATLVHDDVLDEADKRRKVETLNKLWGNEGSILFGDYLFAKAFTLCARLNCPPANVLLAETTERICEGELAQISTKFNPELDEDQYYEIIRKKTASLFGTSCRLGGVNNDADPAHLDAIDRFGVAFGTAFQIVDDCLDLTGDEEVVGKSLGTDLDKGKLTLPLILLLRVLPEGRRSEVRELVASPNGVPDKRTRIVRLLEEHHILDAAMRKAHDRVEEAHASLNELPSSEFTEGLRTLLDFSLSRRK